MEPTQPISDNGALLRPYTVRLDACVFATNDAGQSCQRGCGNRLDEPLAPGTYFGCGAGREIVGGYLFWCPGCRRPHPYRVAASPWDKPGTPVWTFNGDLTKPSFSPSLLVLCSDGKTECHLFLTDGVLSYCGDSAHALAGQSVPLGPFTWGDE